MTTSLKSCTVAEAGRFTVFDMAPETSGVRAATISTCPCGAMNRVPVPHTLAVSKMGRCSGLRWGAPSIFPSLTMPASSTACTYDRISSTCEDVYPKRARASAITGLAMVMNPPPKSFLYAMWLKNGSIDVAAQSMAKLMVPVGANTLTCALR